MSGKSEVPAEHIVAHLNAAVIGNRVPQKPIPACRAATCAARAKRQPNQPARSIVLRSYGKTPAARLGRRPERRHRTGSPRRFVAGHSAEGAMFPIAEATLSLDKIAEYWSREIHPRASSNELLGVLVSAWWLGELRGDSVHSRLQLLKMMLTSKYRDDLGIIFIVGNDAGPPPVDLPDESLEIDLRPQIRVPSSNIESLDEAACRDAFHALAEITKTSSIKSYWEFGVSLPSIKLTYEEFSTWCAKRSYDVPKFWKSRDQLVPPQERKIWQAKPGKRLTTTEAAVVKAMNELFPDGKSDLTAKARDELIQNRVTHRAVSSRTIQRTLEKIHFV